MSVAPAAAAFPHHLLAHQLLEHERRHRAPAVGVERRERGARLPGVISATLGMLSRCALYWTIWYRVAVRWPSMRFLSRSTIAAVAAARVRDEDRLGLERLGDDLEPGRAHRRVPVSTRSTTASASPSPHAASTEPETNLMRASRPARAAARRRPRPRLGRAVVLREELAREHRERRHDALARERARVGHAVLHGRLHRERALAEAERQELLDGLRRLLDHVLARDAHVDVALRDVRGDVGGRQEDERDGQVRAVRDVDALGLRARRQRAERGDVCERGAGDERRRGRSARRAPSCTECRRRRAASCTLRGDDPSSARRAARCARSRRDRSPRDPPYRAQKVCRASSGADRVGATLAQPHESKLLQHIRVIRRKISS